MTYKEAIKRLKYKVENCDGCGRREDDITAFDMAIDALAMQGEPVRHGHWIWVKDHWECSVCRGNRFTTDLVLGLDAAYCGRCGAKMDEVSE